MERIKFNQRNSRLINQFFWRTYNQKEVDYVEEHEGKLAAYEFKWNPMANVKIPKDWVDNYPDSEFSVISRDDYQNFLT